MLGTVVTGSGYVLTASGDVALLSGAAVRDDAGKLWDFASGDPASRPPIARERAVPPAPILALKAKDPTPAEALRMKNVPR